MEVIETGILPSFNMTPHAEMEFMHDEVHPVKVHTSLLFSTFSFAAITTLLI